jgi:hypothetical protein
MLTKKQRQEIIQDFASRQKDRRYHAAGFLAEVEATGESHPAWSWFEWDQDKAAHQHRLGQAREFAQGLEVYYKTSTVKFRNMMYERKLTIPFVHSPMETRRVGGGYILTDGKKEAHWQELAHEGAEDLDRWLRRFGGTMDHFGESLQPVQALIVRLREHADVLEDEPAS